MRFLLLLLILPITAKVSASETCSELNLYIEVQEMLDNSLLMYPVAVFRKWAKDGKLPAEFLREDVTANQVIQAIQQNKDTIDALAEENEVFDIEMNAINTIAARQDLTKNSNATLVEFNDDNASEELVYAVGVDHTRERVTVSFRGTSNKNNWMHNVQAWMEAVPNPMSDRSADQPKRISIHNGFYEYLFIPGDLTPSEIEELRKVTSTKVEKLTKFEEIMQLHVLPQLRKVPGYKLYVTGHSLGGALATLFAFQAATSSESYPEILYPVTCISFASPYAGGNSFRKAFNSAEKMGLLRHLRVSNENDGVPTIPFVSINPFNWVSGKGLFKHVGLNLRLSENLDSKNGPCFYQYAGSKGTVKQNSVLTNFPGGDLLKNHGLSEYDKRLNRCVDSMSNASLESVYKQYASW